MVPSVMVSSLQEIHGLVGDLVRQAVFLGDTEGPTTRQYEP